MNENWDTLVFELIEKSLNFLFKWANMQKFHIASWEKEY